MALSPTTKRRCAMDTYEILLDADTVIAFGGGRIAWIACSDDWRADGIDPKLFPGGVLPMKRSSLTGHGVSNYAIAAKYFAMAHRAERVNGPPRLLLTLKLSCEAVVEHLFAGDLTIDHRTQTLGFLKTIAPDNYPGLQDVEIRQIAEKVGGQLLEIGYAQLSQERVAMGAQPSGWATDS